MRYCSRMLRFTEPQNIPLISHIVVHATTNFNTLMSLQITKLKVIDKSTDVDRIWINGFDLHQMNLQWKLAMKQLTNQSLYSDWCGQFSWDVHLGPLLFISRRSDGKTVSTLIRSSLQCQDRLFSLVLGNRFNQQEPINIWIATYP